MKHHNKIKIYQLLFLLTIITFLQGTQFLILSSVNSGIINSDSEIRFKAAGGSFTREYSPIILNKENAPELWTELDNLHVDNMRVAYHDGSNWILVPFQLDEKGYVRTFTYKQGFQISLKIDTDDPINDADLCNYGRYQAIKRYLGKNIDAGPDYTYQELTKYECELEFWDTINAENWENDLDNAPPPTPIQESFDLPQNWHRVDYDDELYFYAYNGNNVSSDNWWNEEIYPNRFEIEIKDPVDGGQAWMYLYYNDDPTIPVNTNHYFIPSNGPHADVDYVNWNKTTLAATGVNYNYSYDFTNVDISRVSVDNFPIIDEMDKEYISTGFKGGVNYTIDYYIGTLDINYNVNTNEEIWREGTWKGDYYDEIKSYIGYGLTMDLDLAGIEEFPGQDSDLTNAHDYDGYNNNQNHSELDDNRKYFDYIIGEYEYCAADSADHDGELDENIAFARGKLDDSHVNGEAAIDGPCRVIINKYNLRVTGFYVDDIIEWEEFYLVTNMESWFSANMMGDFENTLSMNFSFGESDLEFKYEINIHYAYYLGQQYNSEFINNLDSYIMFGQAPNGNSDLPNLTQCNDEGKNWPLVCYPDGILDNDDYVIGDGPIPDHFNNTPINPNSLENPLSDWVYACNPDIGGILIYIPYQEFKVLFNEGSSGYADLSAYWADNSEITEFSMYGNDADINSATEPFEKIVIFADLHNEDESVTDFNCKKEYARMKMKLCNNLNFSLQEYNANDNFPDNSSSPSMPLIPILIIGGGVVAGIIVLIYSGKVRSKRRR